MHSHETLFFQVFRIPVEERRGMLESNSDFGADDSLKILNNVMDKTKAKIEMSSSKDKSLTFLITGKQDVVLRARRELLSQFQVRTEDVVVGDVGWVGAGPCGSTQVGSRVWCFQAKMK